MTKRFVRLREHAPGSDRRLTPTSSQRENSNGLGEGPFRVRTDENGYILTGNEVCSNLKTIVLGDSFIECSFLHEEQRICSVLEALDNVAGSEIVGNVLNGGYSGATTIHLLNVLLNKVFSDPPDRLVFVLPANDAVVHRFSSVYWNTSEHYGVIYPPDREKATSEMGGYAKGIGADCRRLVYLIIEACRMFSVDLSLATFPHMHRFDAWPFMERKYPSRAWFDAVCLARKELNEIVRGLSVERGIRLIDLERILNGSPEFFYDELHVNSAGSEFTARAMYEAVSVVDGA